MTMNLKELADLVVVRNHLATLLDTQWRTTAVAQMSKADIRKLNEIRGELDAKFLAGVLDLNKLPATIEEQNSKNKQLLLDFDKPKKKSGTKVVRVDG